MQLVSHTLILIFRLYSSLWLVAVAGPASRHVLKRPEFFTCSAEFLHLFSQHGSQGCG